MPSKTVEPFKPHAKFVELTLFVEAQARAQGASRVPAHVYFREPRLKAFSRRDPKNQHANHIMS